MSCLFRRNNRNEVYEVRLPNGNRSLLFDKIASIPNLTNDQAVTIYKNIFSPEFIEKYGEAFPYIVEMINSKTFGRPTAELEAQQIIQEKKVANIKRLNSFVKGSDVEFLSKEAINAKVGISWDLLSEKYTGDWVEPIIVNRNDGQELLVLFNQQGVPFAITYKGTVIFNADAVADMKVSEFSEINDAVSSMFNALNESNIEGFNSKTISEVANEFLGEIKYAVRNASEYFPTTIRQATMLEAKGLSETDIFEQTGLFKGTDGNWKYVSDNSTPRVKVTNVDLASVKKEISDVKENTIQFKGKRYTARLPFLSNGIMTQESRTFIEPMNLVAMEFQKGEDRSENAEIEAQTKILTDYAKKNNLWIEDTSSLGEVIQSGSESIVRRKEGEDFVTKETNLSLSATPLEFFDRALIFNRVFPNSKISLVGFTEVDGEFKIVTKQPYFEISEEKVEVSDIQQFMEDKGFVRSNDVYLTDQFLIEDLNIDNIVRNENGEIVVIDAVAMLNTEDEGYGGKAEYGKVSEVTEMVEVEANDNTELPIEDNNAIAERMKNLTHSQAIKLIERLGGRFRRC